MGWEDSDFPHADDPQNVGWLISYWRITPCSSGCVEDYQLESRQFDHLVKAATPEQALEKFSKYVDQKRASGHIPDIKGLTLFLSRVEQVVVISDLTGAVR